MNYLNKVPGYIKLGLGRFINIKNIGLTPQDNRKTLVYNHIALLKYSTQALPQRPRKYLKIINYSPNVVYYAFDTNASINQIYLAPGMNDEYLVPPYSSVNVIALIADSQIQILENI